MAVALHGRCSLLRALLLLGVGGCAPRVTRPVELPPLRPAPAEVERLVRFAIETRFQAGDIPDQPLLDRDPVLVFDEMEEAGYTLSAAAVPAQASGRRLQLISRREAQDRAYFSHVGVFMIAVDRPVVTGESGALKMGAATYPDVHDGLVPIWNCAANAEFRRSKQNWVFVQWQTLGCY
jgi:hypothetical protein